MSIAGAATTFSVPNYVGELFLVGQNKTPFLNMIGGLSGGGKQAVAFEFPIAQDYSLDAGSQPANTESGSMTAPTARSFARAQSKNVCQIFHEAVSVSYAKQSTAGALSGLNIEGANPVRDEKSFQINANLEQIAKDADYSFLNGAYNLAAAANESNKTRGMLEAVTTNAVVNGTPADLTAAMIKTVIRSMADNGAPFRNVVLFANSNQIDRITDLYEDKIIPESRNIAGTAVDTIVTNFCTLGIVWAPAMPDDEILIADVAMCSPVFLPVPGKGFLFYEELSKKGAEESGQLYGQIGLDHGIESFHGKITGLNA